MELEDAKGPQSANTACSPLPNGLGVDLVAASGGHRSDAKPGALLVALQVVLRGRGRRVASAGFRERGHRKRLRGRALGPSHFGEALLESAGRHRSAEVVAL